MAQPYVGEIRMFAGNFAPAGWMFCDGQLLAISENETLFNLIGTTYGGDGQSTFALPDLRGRVPLHPGTGGGGTYVLAETGGVETVTITVQQLPLHNHAAFATNNIGHGSEPSGGVPAVHRDHAAFDSSPTVAMAAGSVAPGGGSQPHNNLAPHLCVNFIISLFGIFPSQT
jgi:microcystin-dependent protein